MSDGRIVRLGPLHRVSVGDYLEVYADIAVEKVSGEDARIIRQARKQRSASV